MRLTATFASLLTLAASAAAQTITGQYDCMPAGDYTLCQNLWGECALPASCSHSLQPAHPCLYHTAAGVGSQNSTLISTSGNTVSWRTQWQWANAPNNVKSYANMLSNSAKGVQLQDISSAPTSWTWDYDSVSDPVRADVSCVSLRSAAVWGLWWLTGEGA